MKYAIEFLLCPLVVYFHTYHVFDSSVWSGDLVKGPLGILKERPLCLRLHGCIVPKLLLILCSNNHLVSVEESSSSACHF